MKITLNWVYFNHLYPHSLAFIFNKRIKTTSYGRAIVRGLFMNLSPAIWGHLIVSLKGS